MRRLTRTLCIAAPVVALAWSGLWVVGRDAIAARLDTGIAELRSGGLGIDIGASSIAGFPFAYAAELRDVTLVDPRSGARTALPELHTEVTLATLGRLTTRLPSRFTITLPIGDELRLAAPDLPDELTVIIEAEGLEMLTEPALDGSLALGLIARRLRVTPETPTETLDFTLGLEGVGARVEMSKPGSGLAGADGRLSAIGLTFASTDRVSGPPRRIDARLAALELTGGGGLADLAGLARILDGQPGAEGRVALTARQIETSLDLDGTTASESGRLSIEADALDSRAEIAEGQLVASATLGRPVVSLLGRSISEPAPETAEPPEATPVSGEIIATRIEADTILPLAPAPEMGPIRLAATAEGVAPADALWSRLDPDEVLSRAPGRAEIAIDGRARWLRPPSEQGPAGEPPIAFERVVLERLMLAGLEATVTGSGALDYELASQRPSGAVVLEFAGVLGLIRRLHEAGLIAQETVQTLATLAAFYTRAGDGPDKLVAEIAIDGDKLSINGDRIR